ncbi:hypothetical protein FRB90_006381, partial [Tulasnella sp. 427]
PLERLAWNGYPDQALTLLQSKEHVGSIRELEWNCPPLNPAPVNVQEVLVEAALNCSNLRMITLTFAPPVDPDAVDSPSIDLVRPLFMCANLKEVDIHTVKPFSLTQSDIAEMAEVWKDLEVLILSPDPEVTRVRTGTPISLFSQLALALPHLRSVGLYFSTYGFELSNSLPLSLAIFWDIIAKLYRNFFMGGPSGITGPVKTPAGGSFTKTRIIWR